MQKTALAWNITQNSQPDDSNNAANSILIQEGEEAKSTVLQYVDWLVTTCNPLPSNEFWTPPNPHPCAISINDITNLE